MMPAITSRPVPSVMLGSTGSPLARNTLTAVVSVLSLPLVAMVVAPVAEKPNGDTSANTAPCPVVSALVPSATTSLDQFGIQPLTKRPGIDSTRGLGARQHGGADRRQAQQQRGGAESPRRAGASNRR